jgi:hypothetical protein
MKDSLIIMRMTLRILLRKGTVYGLLGLICCLSTAIFYMSRGDGVLVNELEIRISYSYGLTYSILSLSVIALACFTIRSQIDAKNIHLLSSMPLKRKWIFAGQALAIIVVALIAEVMLLGSILINSYVYSSSFSAEEKKQASEKYLISHRKIKPVYVDKRELTLAYAEKGGKDATQMTGKEWYLLSRDALKEEQLIESGKSTTWAFDLGESPSSSKDQSKENTSLIYRFQKAGKRDKVKGVFELTSDNDNFYFKHEIDADQYSFESFNIPMTSVPDSGKFTIKFTNTGKGATIVTRSGIYFKYTKGTIWTSLAKSFLCQGVHLIVTVLVGTCAGVGLTFSVATFMVMMLFVMSSSQGLFKLVMEDYGFTAVLTYWDHVGIFILNAAMWATKGLQPPEIISGLSAGLDLDMSHLLIEWLPAVVFYGLFAYFLGSWMIYEKELDKVQT